MVFHNDVNTIHVVYATFQRNVNLDHRGTFSLQAFLEGGSGISESESEQLDHFPYGY